MSQTLFTDDTLLHLDPPSKTPRLLPGTVVEHYEILGHLGSGGMGAVYRARDQRIGRTVALKLKKPSAEGQTSCRLLCSLLVREGQAMGQLAHPNVLALYDAGLVRGCVYLVLEYVAGTTLREWAHQPRSTREKVDALLAAGRGLAAAHAAGVVHRDFKPDNVLVGDSVVKVSDFGLARTRAQIVEWGVTCGGCGTADAERELARSLDNDAAGTPRYMAPEQLAGEPATELTDQYAFAVTAWEIVSGVYPFVATNVGELRAAMESEPMFGELEAASSKVLRRALRRAPSDRYPSVAELLAELGAASSGSNAMPRSG